MLLGSRNLCVEVIFQIVIIFTIYLCYYLDNFLSYMARIIYSWSSQSKIQDLILVKGLPGSGNEITLKAEHTCWSSHPKLRWGGTLHERKAQLELKNLFDQIKQISQQTLWKAISWATEKYPKYNQAKKKIPYPHKYLLGNILKKPVEGVSGCVCLCEGKRKKEDRIQNS